MSGDQKVNINFFVSYEVLNIFHLTIFYYPVGKPCGCSSIYNEKIVENTDIHLLRKRLDN